MRIKRVWLRVGDAAPLEEFASIQEAAQYLNSLHAGQITEWYGSVGFCTPNYHGDDYVSCYWGDETRQPIRGFTADERAEMANNLEEAYI